MKLCAATVQRLLLCCHSAACFVQWCGAACSLCCHSAGYLCAATGQRVFLFCHSTALFFFFLLVRPRCSCLSSLCFLLPQCSVFFVLPPTACFCAAALRHGIWRCHSAVFFVLLPIFVLPLCCVFFELPQGSVLFVLPQCSECFVLLQCCFSFFLSLAATVPQQSGPNGVMGPLGAQYPRCRWGCGWDAPQVHWGTGTQSWGATGTHPRSTGGRVPRVGV